MKSKSSNIQVTLDDLAQKTGARLEGDGGTVITGAAPISSAQPGDISFIANPRYLPYLQTTRASAVVLDEETPCPKTAVLRHSNPYLIFACIVDILYPETVEVAAGVHETSVIESDTSVSSSARIGPLCHVREGSVIGDDCRLVSSIYVGRNVSIGRNCLIYPGVCIMDGSIIGDNTIIHSSTVIGSDGFGFAESESGLKKIKQVGWVEIGNDVEIGSNCSIDRGALGPTVIGHGSKIDNLVQIAHNVEIGRNCIIVSQVGISGSTRLGNGVVLAGQVGVIGHLEIGDGVRVAAQSGVAKSIPAGKTMFGSPARDVMETKRIEVALGRLPELLKRVRKIEDKLGD